MPAAVRGQQGMQSSGVPWVGAPVPGAAASAGSRACRGGRAEAPRQPRRACCRPAASDTCGAAARAQAGWRAGRYAGCARGSRRAAIVRAAAQPVDHQRLGQYQSEGTSRAGCRVPRLGLAARQRALPLAPCTLRVPARLPGCLADGSSRERCVFLILHPLCCGRTWRSRPGVGGRHSAASVAAARPPPIASATRLCSSSGGRCSRSSDMSCCASRQRPSLRVSTAHHSAAQRTVHAAGCSAPARPAAGCPVRRHQLNHARPNRPAPGAAARGEAGEEGAREACEALGLLRLQRAKHACMWRCPCCDMRFAGARSYLHHVQLYHEEVQCDRDDAPIPCSRCSHEVRRRAAGACVNTCGRGQARCVGGAAALGG